MIGKLPEVHFPIAKVRKEMKEIDVDIFVEQAKQDLMNNAGLLGMDLSELITLTGHVLELIAQENEDYNDLHEQWLNM